MCNNGIGAKMGLSSSQGRLLMLTSRLSDIQLSETLISQRQNQLAWQSEEAASVYSEAMNNMKLTIKTTDDDGSTSLEDLTYSNLTSSGYLLVDSSGNLYLTQDSEGAWEIPSLPEGTSLSIDEENNTATITYSPVTYSSSSSSDEDGTEVVETTTDSSKSVTMTLNLVDGTDMLSQKSVMQNAIINGNLFVIDTSALDNGNIGMGLLEANTEMYYEYDTSDDAKAESEYEYETARISRQDNMLELEMNQLETQHEAILKEIDSVKEVISNNVDRTFQLFSDG